MACSRFLRSIETRDPPAATGEHGRQVQAILDAWYASAEQGREIEIGA